MFLSQGTKKEIECCIDEAIESCKSKIRDGLPLSFCNGLFELISKSSTKSRTQYAVSRLTKRLHDATQLMNSELQLSILEVMQQGFVKHSYFHRYLIQKDCLNSMVKAFEFPLNPDPRVLDKISYLIDEWSSKIIPGKMMYIARVKQHLFCNSKNRTSTTLQGNDYEEIIENPEIHSPRARQPGDRMSFIDKAQHNQPIRAHRSGEYTLDTAEDNQPICAHRSGEYALDRAEDNQPIRAHSSNEYALDRAEDNQPIRAHRSGEYALDRAEDYQPTRAHKVSDYACRIDGPSYPKSKRLTYLNYLLKIEMSLDSLNNKQILKYMTDIETTVTKVIKGMLPNANPEESMIDEESLRQEVAASTSISDKILIISRNEEVNEEIRKILIRVKAGLLDFHKFYDNYHNQKKLRSQTLPNNTYKLLSDDVSTMVAYSHISTYDSLEVGYESLNPETLTSQVHEEYFGTDKGEYDSDVGSDTPDSYLVEREVSRPEAGDVGVDAVEREVSRPGAGDVGVDAVEREVSLPEAGDVGVMALERKVSRPGAEDVSVMALEGEVTQPQPRKGDAGVVALEGKVSQQGAGNVGVVALEEEVSRPGTGGAGEVILKGKVSQQGAGGAGADEKKFAPIFVPRHQSMQHPTYSIGLMEAPVIGDYDYTSQ